MLFDELALLAENQDESVSEEGLLPYGYGSRPAVSNTPPFAAEDIILLVDGLCSSTCSLFAEAMTQDAGVRSVAVGGQPQPGPMQGVAGTRGARPLDSDSIDADIQLVIDLDPTLNASFPDRNTGIIVDTLLINLQDQIRANEYFPLQFAFEASDCRIYYTLVNVNDYVTLWTGALDAVTGVLGGKTSCIPDSTGWASEVTDSVGPSAEQKRAWRAAGSLTTWSDPVAADVSYDWPSLLGSLYDALNLGALSSIQGASSVASRNNPRGQFGGGQTGLGAQQFNGNTRNTGRQAAFRSAQNGPAKPTAKVKL